jgi:hypothetical protein
MKEFIKFYDVCARAKHPCHCRHGLLQPLLILASPWFLISMDFLIDLPPFNFYDSILVEVMDYLMKMVHFIPCTKIITSEGTTKLFLNLAF